MNRPAAGGGRRVEVAPERLAGFLERFGRDRGPVTVSVTPELVTVTAADGALAELTVPFPPLIPDPSDAYAGLGAHALVDRRVGVLLVRLGGYAAGVFDGTRLVVSKVGSRQVHGRSAAGGQSQQRFARRREGQVRVALQAATENAVKVLLPDAAALDAVVVGGERTAVDEVLGDRRLAPLLPLVTPPFLDVPDPRHAVLLAAPAGYRAVQVRVDDPRSAAGRAG